MRWHVRAGASDGAGGGGEGAAAAVSGHGGIHGWQHHLLPQGPDLPAPRQIVTPVKKESVSLRSFEDD